MSDCKIGKVFVSAPFLLLSAWMLYRDDSGFVFRGLFACLFHELGHCAALWNLGNSIKELRISLFGAQIVPGDSLSYGEELAVAASGPAVNLILAIMLGKTTWGLEFAALNLGLGLFNLLPVGELDGARVLRCVLSLIFSDGTACVISEGISSAVTVLFSVLGFFIGILNRNVSLFLMTVWLLERSLRKKHCNSGKKNRDRSCQMVEKPLK